MAGGTCEFWYLTWGNGQSGYLLDLVRRPDQAVARLAIFRRGEAPRVLRKTFPREALRVDVLRPAHARDPLRADGGPRGVELELWRLDAGHCSGAIEGWFVSCDLQLQPRAITLVPAWIGRLYPSVPALQSTPGTITRGEVKQPGVGAIDQRDLPCVFTHYRVGDVARARWFLISAHAFEGSDARCEISGGWFAGRWALTGYLFIDGQMLPLNSPVANLRRFHVQAVGDQAGPARRLAIGYRSRRLVLRLIAEAPAGTFVDLEREGATTIRTSLFASCALEVSVDGRHRQLASRDRCLLEVKH